MSRHQYIDDYDDDLQLGRWRGQVASAINGKRGQKFLRDLVAALEAMPVKELIAEELQDEDGAVCGLGSVGLLRGMDLSKIDPEDYDQVAAAFDIAAPLAREIEYENDEGGRHDETPEQRHARVLKWAKGLILAPAQKGAA